jgi:hypothetical protein
VAIDGVYFFGYLALLEEHRGLVFLGDEHHALGGHDAWVSWRVPMAEPVLLMASTAYSSCWRRPSGEKVVVLESYLRDIYGIFKIDLNLDYWLR